MHTVSSSQRPARERRSATRALRAAASDALRKLRPWVRDLGGELFYRAAFTRPSRFAYEKLSIVTLHRVLPPDLLAEYPIPSIAVTPHELDWLIQLFEQHYTLGTLGEIATRFTLGDRPERPLLALTFDDGQRDNFEHARPVLARHGVHASFFVVADATENDQTLWHDRVAYGVCALRARDAQRASALLGELGVSPHDPDPANAAVARLKAHEPDTRERWIALVEAAHGVVARPSWDGMMNWQQLKQLHAEGHEIGSHSQTHPILPLVSDSRLQDEVAGSRQLLRQKLQFEIESFCYPNGDCDARVIQAVKVAGYRHAVTTRYGINHAGASHYTWKRFDLQSRHARAATGELSESRLLLRMTGQLPGAR
jgi:peptidoglycan/xylan/chitin deacetylase (PgdA/CDA1 family)